MVQHRAVVSQGRCLLVDVQAEQFASSVMNVHITPSLPTVEKKSLIRRLLDTSYGENQLYFYCGDWNFTASDDDRINLADTSAVGHDIALAEVFDGHSRHLVELYQPAFTRRQVIRGGLTSLSRLDRIYVNLPPAELVDRRPFACTEGYISDPRIPSDHVPVSATSIGPNLFLLIDLPWHGGSRGTTLTLAPLITFLAM